MNMEHRKKRIAVIGTQGVPAHYGGFESLVENIIGPNQSNDVEYTVYCSTPLMDKSLPRYKGATLKYIPVNAHGARSILYDFLSMLKSLRDYDDMLILGVSGCTALPLIKTLTKARIIVNIDGHEYRRHKWGSVARAILKISEAAAVKYADTIITDNKGISEYVKTTYGRDTELIAYGGDHVMRTLPIHKQNRILKCYGLKPEEYACAICRTEPENNCEMILRAFNNHPPYKLVFIGNWGYSDYSKRLYKEYVKSPYIMLPDAIYDLDVLYAIRNNARCYIHGHSAGGTNPSLVEAMFFGRPILAFNVVYNRETTFGEALYFNNHENLRQLLDFYLPQASMLSEKARQFYSWNTIAKQYEDLY